MKRKIYRSLGVPLQTYFTVVAIKLPYKCAYGVRIQPDNRRRFRMYKVTEQERP
jgi:hypothetical protein